MNKDFGVAQYRAFGTWSDVTIFAGGVRPGPVTKISIEDIDLSVNPPLYGLYFESSNVGTMIMLPFLISRIVSRSLFDSATIKIIDANGEHEVEIELPFDPGGELSDDLLRDLKRMGPYAVFQQLGEQDQCMIARAGAIVPAIYREVYWGTQQECEAWASENCTVKI